MTIMEPRQPITALSKARGAAAVYPPRPPIPIRKPVMRTYFSGSNQLVRIFIVGTKTIATPSPTMVRANIAVLALQAKPKMMAPAAAKAKKKVMERRGPQESAKSPAGICINA
ncbi:MAG: hypothetical protein BWY90_00700 [Deltaproteobacteria bacterium ADurb.BinA014]|nr:MAG: hypothetical protein BWY90_00700 [Deltaproteobacteria bacterium ADurb.BinA014]